jgi:hypothetical protein
MTEPIVNKVSESALETINLETFLPVGQPRVFDLKEHLFRGLILKEKEFREILKTTDWEAFRNEEVVVTCSADAIIPVWAYMLAASYLKQVTHRISFESPAQWKDRKLLENIRSLDVNDFSEKRVVIKGCGEEPIPEAAYFEITSRLLPVVKSIMYGEPCSTVPVYKKK